MKRGQDYYDSIGENRINRMPDDVFQDYLRADALNKENKTDEAREILLPILERFPNNAAVLNVIGNSYLADKDYKAAEDYYQKSLKIDATLHFVHANLCNLYIKVGRTEKAGECARDAVKFGSKAATAWNSLGLYYVHIGQIDNALDHFSAALSLDDKRPDIQYNIACALIALGKTEEGLEKLELSLASIWYFQVAQDDESLSPVRGMPEFKRIMAEAGEIYSGGK